MSLDTAETPAVEAPIANAPIANAPIANAPIASDSQDKPPVVEAPSAKAPDWATTRDAYAKGDDKVLKRLSRYSSQEAALDALIAAQNKISSGGLKEALPEKPTDKQLADWRESNGIPATPQDYKVSLPEGVDLDDGDQGIVEKFLETAHGANMTPAQAEKTLEFLFSQQEAQREEQAAQEDVFRAESEETLRQEWGSEFKLNRNMILGLLDTAPEGVKDQVLGARLANGTPLGNDPLMLRWLANLAREINPVATVVPTGGSTAQTIEQELNSIKSMMGDRDSKYWKGPEASGIQKRFLDLTRVKERTNR